MMKEGDIVLAFGIFPVCRICYKPEMNCDCDVPFEPLRAKPKAQSKQKAGAQ